jgi:hypothetical protein
MLATSRYLFRIFFACKMVTTMESAAWAGGAEAAVFLYQSKIRTLYDELDSKEAICWTRNPSPLFINSVRSNFTACTIENVE